MDRITLVTEGTFNALAPLRQASIEQPEMFEVVRLQLSTAIEQAFKGARNAGFSAADAEDIRLALIALVDETMLAKRGQFREYWLQQTLQYKQYGEMNCGKTFFERLDELRGDASRSEVMLVYYLCLLFNFRGKYRSHNNGERDVTELLVQLRNEIGKAGLADAEAELAPHGARPHEPMIDRQRNILTLWIAAAAASVAGIYYLSLKFNLALAKAEVLDQLRAAIGG